MSEEHTNTEPLQENTELRRYYFLRNCFLPLPFAILIWGVALLTFWSLWFKLSDRNCLVNNYEISTEQRCPWPDQCFDVQCVEVDVNYFSDHGSHATAVPVWYLSQGDPMGCSTKSKDWVVKDLDDRYPIKTNQTCYARNNPDGSGQTIFFTDILTSNYIFFVSIGCFVAAPALLIIIILMLCLYKKKYVINNYEPLNVNE